MWVSGWSFWLSRTAAPGTLRRAAAPAPAGAGAPAGSSLPALVSTDELARWQAEGPVVVLDVRTDVFTYLKGHLPGAEYLNTETLRASEGGIPTRLLSAGAYRDLFSRLGIDSGRPVVIYSAGETHNIDATFLAWLLAGADQAHVFVLDGGFFKWQLEQRPVVQPYPRIPVTHFPERAFRPEAASLEERAGARFAQAPCWSTRGRRTSTRARPARRCATGTSRGRSTTTGRTI